MDSYLYLKLVELDQNEEKSKTSMTSHLWLHTFIKIEFFKKKKNKKERQKR